MKTTLVWALVALNVLLAGALVGRSMRPNAAVAQGVAGGRPGDYTIIPVDFPGATVGSIIVLDNVTGEMSAIQTDESAGRMVGLPRVNVTRLFDVAGNRRPVR
jgi:hypothetical protein